MNQKSPVNIFDGVGKSAFLSLVILSLVSNLLMLTGPVFMLQVYDRVLASKSLPTLTALVFLIVGLFAFYGFVEAIRQRMALRFANVIDQSIARYLFAASVKLRLTSGSSSTLDPVRDGDTIRGFLAGSGPLSLLDLPWVPVYLAIIFIFHAMLGWLAVGGGGIIVILMLMNEFAQRKLTSVASSAAATRQRYSDDARDNAEAIVAMGMLSDVSKRWLAQSGEMLVSQRIGADRSTTFSSLTKAIRFLFQSLVLAAGAYLVIQNEMTGGLMIAASIITSRALAPIEHTIAQWRGFVQARQAWGRVRMYLASGDKPDRSTTLPLPSRTFTVRHVSSAPAGLPRPVISGVSFELAAGDGLGVLGGSGSGKTSLIRVLQGVWPVTAGELRLDGAMLAHYDDSQFQRMFGYLPQRVELLNGTVAENIARFSPDATSGDVIAAARLAGIHDLVNALPNGYDTQIGLQGSVLSAGQRQRIGLARALYGDPFIVVLDEPNANLDSEGDAALAEAIRAVRARGGIAVVVAHRPSAIAAVDKVLFMRDGRQAAFGPKQEILQQITGDNVHALKVPS